MDAHLGYAGVATDVAFPAGMLILTAVFAVGALTVARQLAVVSALTFTTDFEPLALMVDVAHGTFHDAGRGIAGLR